MNVTIIVQKLQGIVPRLANVRNDPKLERNISNYEQHFFSRKDRKKRLEPIEGP